MEKLQQEQRRIVCAVGALVCAAVVFILIFSAYAQRFDRTLKEENRYRLDEVSGHVAAYMERAVEQQWNEFKVVVAACASVPGEEARVAYLGRMAKELDFEYIGISGDDGLLRAAAFREPLDISGEDYFLAAGKGEPFMTGLRRYILWDRAASGVIFSMPAPEGTGAAVTAMLSVAKLGADVQVDSFDGNGFSYIIDARGNQVLHARSMAYNNLFRAMQNMRFEEGYSLESMRSDIAARCEGMTAYSDLGVEKYAYYRPLSFNGWTVVSIVPKGVITARTSALSRELIVMCTVASLVFLGLVSLVGVLLLRLESRRRSNRAKSVFLANMSHDMRTPMNAIIGMTTIADAHAGEPDTVRDCMRKIGFSGKHLLGLINDVLDMSRIESGKMTLCREPFFLAEVLESAENMIFPQMRAKGQQFSVRLHGVRDEYFVGDDLRLCQIMVNILTNAVKFTPEEGRISVDVEELASEEPSLAVLRFTFADNGIGMKPEFLKLLFTPFTQERSSRSHNAEGSGLGMAITKRIVDLMGGSIEVESQEGRGTVFTVTLSLSVWAGAPKAALPFGWKILLAGGGEEEGREAERALGDMGLTAVWRPEVRSAAACLAEGSYQAVFVDREVYSAEMVRTLREAGGPEPALFLSAYDWEDIRQEAARGGIQYFVQKPLFRETLGRALRRAAGMEADEKKADPVPDLSGRNILLAEDNELNLEIIRTVLEEAGAATLCAGNGAECVELFETSPISSFDLILMDIQMPRMNGYEAAANIRALTRPDALTPILAMSANAFAEDIDAAFKAGMNGYLTKPIDLPAWMAEIEKNLRK